MPNLALLGGPKTVTLKADMRWPRVGEEEIAAVVDALRKSSEDISYLTSYAGGGPTEAFEQDFCSVIGVKYALSTNSGGAALHIAIMAAGVEAGDEVIVSGYTWGQTVSCILQQNAIPVFADIDPETYTLDPKSIEEKISPYTKAIVVVHLYGQAADMDPIMEIARKYGLMVIEDCAQATGATYKGRRVGSIGHFGCFSIGSGKQIIGGEGGLVVTNDEELFERACLYGCHPARANKVIKDPKRRLEIDNLIYTYRIHPLAAVIARVQLRYLDEWNEQRRQNCERLSRGLAGIPGIRPPAVREECEHVYHIYAPSFIPREVEGVSRELYVKALQAEGVPLGLGYVRTPIYLRRRFQQYHSFFGKGLPWSGRFVARPIRYAEGDCPVTEALCRERELNLGTGAGALGDQSAIVDQYIAAFEKVAANLDELRGYQKEQQAG